MVVEYLIFDRQKQLLYKLFVHVIAFKVDFVSYCDELAEMIGCKPNLLKLFVTDPLLSLKCFFGPCTPPHYRLMGHGSWNGAKQAIQNAQHNVIYATKPEFVKQSSKYTFLTMFKILSFVILGIALCYQFT